MRKVKLILEDGTAFEGKSFGYEKSIAGEVVFYTAMTVRYPRPKPHRPFLHRPDPGFNLSPYR